MKLSKEIVNKIDKIINEHLISKIVLDKKLITEIFFENKEYFKKGNFLNDYFEEAVKIKNSHMISNAFVIFYDNSNRYVYNKVIQL